MVYKKRYAMVPIILWPYRPSVLMLPKSRLTFTRVYFDIIDAVSFDLTMSRFCPFDPTADVFDLTKSLLTLLPVSSDHLKSLRTLMKSLLTLLKSILALLANSFVLTDSLL